MCSNKFVALTDSVSTFRWLHDFKSQLGILFTSDQSKEAKIGLMDKIVSSIPSQQATTLLKRERKGDMPEWCEFVLDKLKKKMKPTEESKKTEENSTKGRKVNIVLSSSSEEEDGDAGNQSTKGSTKPNDENPTATGQTKTETKPSGGANNSIVEVKVNNMGADVENKHAASYEYELAPHEDPSDSVRVGTYLVSKRGRWIRCESTENGKRCVGPHVRTRCQCLTPFSTSTTN